MSNKIFGELTKLDIDMTCNCGERFWLSYDFEQKKGDTVCKKCQLDSLDVLISIKEQMDKR